MKITIEKAYSFHQNGNRDNQEDARFPDNDVVSNGNFFVVCDGVGGAEKGEVASRIVCQTIGRRLAEKNVNDSEITVSDISEIVDSAYDALDEMAEKNPETSDMGTTLTLLCLHKGGAVSVHIGDSRIYQFRRNYGCIFKTEDHSLVNNLVKTGLISPEEAINHPQRNVITRAMSPTSGKERRSMITISFLSDIKAGDYFLLCSDGVIGELSDQQLYDILLGEGSDEEKVAKMAKLSENADDNNTAFIVPIAKVTGTSETPETLETSETPDPKSYSTTQPLPQKFIKTFDIESTKKPGKKKSAFARFFDMFK